MAAAVTSSFTWVAKLQPPLGSGVGVAGAEGLTVEFAQTIAAFALVDGRRKGETVHDDAFGRPGSILQSLHMSLPALGAVRIFLSFVCQASADDGKKGRGVAENWNSTVSPGLFPVKFNFSPFCKMGMEEGPVPQGKAGTDQGRSRETFLADWHMNVIEMSHRADRA